MGLRSNYTVLRRRAKQSRDDPHGRVSWRRGGGVEGSLTAGINRWVRIQQRERAVSHPFETARRNLIVPSASVGRNRLLRVLTFALLVALLIFDEHDFVVLNVDQDGFAGGES